ncbi:MAG: PilN domain-containing protein [Candidatus Omnitrophica bacterium]|nr:PilN domain-containing protein [Candidatus Omnitrophota bacterium]
MLRVNLLPDGARKAALSPLEQLHRTPLMWLAAAVMVLFAASLTASRALGHRRLQALNAKIQALAPKKAEVDQIQRLLQQLRAQEAAFRGLKRGQGLWSKRLNALSNVTPDGVWFTELVLDPAKGLILQGAVIGEGGSEMVRVGQLVQSLQADPDFASAVQDIQIESIKRLQEQEIEVVQFTLTGALVTASSAAPTS